ncbi:MAG: tRNA preQ1(34) S-adenosylmethionine ribosyltransferase-isomerase QueA [Elusimicrobia bacterium]|nr:tRNA preQ1(34) S-adenosylmethionine ribosyltransferase-isomerase QueA [Elusimicrobiota bacterium]
MSSQNLSDFYYDLPKRFIAQYPSRKRDESKLLVLHRNTGKIEHKIFRDIVEYFDKGDVLVINNTKVIPARLFGKKQTGGKIEILLLNEGKDNIVNVIAKPSKNLKIGDRLFFGDDFCEIISISDGFLKVKFSSDIEIVVEKQGKMPLPPYIKRDLIQDDIDRYQTVFASIPGSVAAPTAGLHFTERIFKDLKNKDIEISEVLLHISWATFSPVRCKNIVEHKMGTEYFELNSVNADKINASKRKIAVGTTSVRVLETVSKGDKVLAKNGTTDIFIYPGYSFKNVDAMITNFHLPETTLLMLVCAFAGKDLIFKVYEEAKKENYRFASYGDAMLIL